MEKFKYIKNQLIINNTINKFLTIGHETPKDINVKLRINNEIVKYENTVMIYNLRQYKILIVNDYSKPSTHGLRLRKYICKQAPTLGYQVFMLSDVSTKPELENLANYFHSIKWIY